MSEADEDADSLSSFADAKSHDGDSATAEVAADERRPREDVPADLGVRGAAGDAEERVDSSTVPEYDESLPDGRSFRRRRRSVLEIDELPDEKRDLEIALALKTDGSRHFGLGDHDTAAACYTESLRHFPRGAASEGQVAIGYANRAACHLLCGRLEETVYDCDRALEFNPTYAKALARRATALEKLGKLEEASKGEGTYSTDSFAYYFCFFCCQI